MRKTASKCNQVAENDATNTRSTPHQKALNQFPNALSATSLRAQTLAVMPIRIDPFNS